jgi:hypothetical protein
VSVLALWPRKYTFLVRNAGTANLENVMVHLGGGEASTGSLAAGAIATVTIRSRDASGLVVFIYKGSGFHATGFEDVVVGPITSLVIDGDLRVSFDVRPVA